MARPEGVVRSKASVREYESDVEIAEFLKGRHQVRHGTSPAVQPPNDDDIDVAAVRGIEQLLRELAHGRSRSHFFDLDGNRPAAPGGIVPHGAVL